MRGRGVVVPLDYAGQVAFQVGDRVKVTASAALKFEVDEITETDEAGSPTVVLLKPLEEHPGLHPAYYSTKTLVATD